jgi:hypothetical protein
MESFVGLLIPIMTLVMVIAVQILFWFPMAVEQDTTTEQGGTVVADDVPSSSIIVSSHSSSNTVEEVLVDLKNDTQENEERTEKEDESITSSEMDLAGVESKMIITVAAASLTGIEMVTKVVPETLVQSSRTSQSQAYVRVKDDNKNNTEREGNDDKEEEEEEDDADDESNNIPKWRCVCQNGFLPPGLLKSFGSAESVMRLGMGQCYHKQP